MLIRALLDGDQRAGVLIICVEFDGARGGASGRNDIDAALSCCALVVDKRHVAGNRGNAVVHSASRKAAAGQIDVGGGLEARPLSLAKVRGDAIDIPLGRGIAARRWRRESGQPVANPVRWQQSQLN